MYSTSKRIIAFILLSSQLLTTTSCNGNFNIPIEPQIVHTHHQQVDKKWSQDNALVPLTSELGFDECKKDDAPDQSLTNQLPLVESNSASATEGKALFVGRSKTLKKNKEQKSVSSQAKTFTTPVYIDRPTGYSRKLTHDKAIGDKHFTTLNKSKDLDSYREQARASQKQVSELSDIALNVTVAELLTIDQGLIAKGGHQVYLTVVEGKWMAIVKENAPIGFSRTQYLDLYLAPGFTTNQLSKHSPEWQEAHIGVVFPEKSSTGKGYVYIGDGGLLGGGNSGSKGGGGNDSDRTSSRSESSERSTSGSSHSSSSSSGRASHNIGSSHSSFSMPKTSSSSSHHRDSFKDFCNKSSANVSASLSSAGIKHDTHSTSHTSDSFKDFCDKSSANVSAMLSSAGIKHDTHSTSHSSFSSHTSSYSSSRASNQAASSSNSESKPAASKESSSSSKESKAPHLTLENAATEVRKHIQEAKNDGPKATSVSASQQQQAKGEQLLKQLREIKQQQERSYSQTQTAYITPGNSEIGNKLLLDQLTKKGQELSTLKELESELTQSLERERPTSHYEETRKESILASATTTPKEIKVKDKGKEKDTSLTPGTTQATNNLHSTTLSSSGDISTATSTTEPLLSTPTKGPAVKVESGTRKTKIPYNDRADSFSYDHYSSSTSTNTPAVSATEPTNPATSSTTSTSTTDKSEAEIHNQWSDLLKEIQVQLGHSKIQGLADALYLQKQARFYIEKLKSYEKYKCISRSSLEQALTQ
ncbi:hypothetical protein Aasi_0847 [Candidatus Amoebophilus asiaticus 5a2]|uniref:Uncharacterized protein n=2 Tax=Amoebophilus asiaticus (strain 5a2) TaxID=452471 RepID=B3ESL6_AMOA5|nr:hypothetical protein [Candidatus Amoebophilus asiaticus]ACE06218.1 hypothetical protein Aasi_0847 [Candidatus Amoebophilus asiaticus 5a2]